MANYKNGTKDVLNIFKALADLSRIRILMSLRGGPLCVCQVVALLGLAPSTVSKHLYILRQSDLIEAEKKGRWMHYRSSASIDKKFLKWLYATLAGDKKIQTDAATLKRIVSEDPEKLCQRIRKN